MRGKPYQSGVTLIEVTVSTALVGLVLVAALETLGGALRTTRQTRDAIQAYTLAETLMAEITTLPYADSENDTGSLGLESDESAFASDRTLFDDIDDFHGWTRTPPESREGTALVDYTDWKRSVEVSFLGFNSVSGSLYTTNRDEGLKLVRVRVTDDQGAITELDAILGAHGPNESPAPFDLTRVIAIEAEIAVGDGETLRKRATLPNPAESPTP